MKKARKSPLRTCIGCRVGNEKQDLVRIVRTAEGHVEVDPSGKASGRGAYVCRKVECFDSAMQRRRIDSALRVRLMDDDNDRLRREFIEAFDASKQGSDA